MTTSETAPTLPDQTVVDDSIKLITDHAQRIFTWDYERGRDQLVTLYNKAMASQWNSVTELDWATEVDPERLVETSPQQNAVVELARAAADVTGSPFASWGDKEFTQLGIESLKAQMSQFMHGEQGAMMVAAKIVETVPWIDAKYYAATQTMDEARHTEVFAKYLDTKLVPNVRKLGLLDANNGHLRTLWGDAGLLRWEFADDTGSDYETYDAVAADRAAAGVGA